MPAPLPIELAEVEQAAARLAGVAHRTPVITARTLDRQVGALLRLKAENLQRTGAFKFRGAYNAISALDGAGLARGVLGASSGNHAQALALAAALRGARATILMPEDAPAAKVAATRGYGAEVLWYDRYRDDRDAILAELAAARGVPVVPSFDHPLVMAGQGTAALELLEDAGPLDVLAVPVGGGGLISGCATAVKARAPGTRVIGVEPEAGDDVRRSLVAGRRVRIPVPRTIADGQQLPAPGELTFAVIAARVDSVVTVSDAELVAAMRLAFERLKLVLEPSGASALAAVLAGRVAEPGERVGVILSGGNVDPERFARLIAGES